MARTQSILELASASAQRVMCADAVQTRLIHRMAKFGSGFVVVAGGFDLAIAGSAELMQGALEVLGQQIAHRIELQADGLVERRGGEAGGRRGSGRGGARGLQKISARGSMVIRSVSPV